MTELSSALVDPTACEREQQRPAPRRRTLAASRVLLVDATLNKASRWGAGMLDAAHRVLAGAASCDRVELDPLDVRPGAWWVDAVASGYDAVVIAAGDCITCTSRAARNVVLAERAGIPSALVCTAATEQIARAVGYSLGLPGVRLFPVAESLFGRSRPEIADLVEASLADLARTLTTSDPPPEQEGSPP
jgi:hypothetical protein